MFLGTKFVEENLTRKRLIQGTTMSRFYARRSFRCSRGVRGCQGCLRLVTPDGFVYAYQHHTNPICIGETTAWGKDKEVSKFHFG